MMSFRVALVLALFAIPCVAANAKDEPYYGFFPSSLGPTFKQVRHTLLGFSIDVPSRWNFGVNSKGGFPVAVFYPEGSDQSQLSPAYQSIEVSTVPFTSVSLREVHRHVLVGLKNAHPGLKELEAPTELKLRRANAIQFLVSWRSKSGVDIVEWITLVAHRDGVRSVAVRGSNDLFVKERALYRTIVSTFEAFEPKLPLR